MISPYYKIGRGLLLCAAVFAVTAPAADDSAKVARLSLEVRRVEDIRTVKKLEIFYAQYLQFGLWSQAASLFTENAEAIYGGDDLRGRAAIGKYFLTNWGNAREGLPMGVLHTILDDSPAVSLSADGETAKGRWHEFWMTGQFGGSARWEQGITENDYVKGNGVWKISRINYYVDTTGPYETGWVNAGPDVKLLPFHYTPAEAGMPIPPIPADMKMPAIKGPAGAALAALNRRIRSMNDEDKVANLQERLWLLHRPQDVGRRE